MEGCTDDEHECYFSARENVSDADDQASAQQNTPREADKHREADSNYSLVSVTGGKSDQIPLKCPLKMPDSLLATAGRQRSQSDQEQSAISGKKFVDSHYDGSISLLRQYCNWPRNSGPLGPVRGKAITATGERSISINYAIGVR
jgi:hypothetical protein